MASHLPAPAAAERDPRSVNMATLWLAENGLHCSLKVGLYEGRPHLDEAKAWGVILADTARHLADAMRAAGITQEPRETVVHRIWTSFHEELSKPSAAEPGTFVKGGS